MGTIKTKEVSPKQRKVALHFIFDVSASLFNNIEGSESVMQDFISSLSDYKDYITLSVYAYSSYTSIVFRNNPISKVEDILEGVSTPSGINTTFDSIIFASKDILDSKGIDDVHNIVVLMQTVEDNSSKGGTEEASEYIKVLQDRSNIDFVAALGDECLIDDYMDMEVHPARLVRFVGSLSGLDSFMDILSVKVKEAVDGKAVMFTKQDKKDILDVI